MFSKVQLLIQNSRNPTNTLLTFESCWQDPTPNSEIDQREWCWNRRSQGATHPLPNIWQISKPYFNWGRAVYPQIFSPSGITERGYTLKITIFTNFATEKSCSMFLENCKKIQVCILGIGSWILWANYNCHVSQCH